MERDTNTWKRKVKGVLNEKESERRGGLRGLSCREEEKNKTEMF